VQQIERFKETFQELAGIFQYPFNQSQRVEFSVGASRISFDHEIRSIGCDAFTCSQVLFDSTVHIPWHNPLTLGVARGALVYDNSVGGYTGPILGSRWRLEADPTFGSLQYTEVLGDFRKYVMPVRPFTIAGRLMHWGRWGRSAEDTVLFPLFLGYPGLVRGYDFGSFDVSECGNAGNTCPVFDQLLGSKLLVGNIELRFPFFGVLGVGSGYWGILPVDAAIFYDAGVAWTDSSKAKFLGGTRNFVRSTGVTFRMNLLGYAIGQMDIVHPFNRPQKNWMVRLSITEGF
jgi:outer membrane protein assembly factor BamA